MNLANNNLIFDLGTKYINIYKNGECVKKSFSYMHKDDELLFLLYDSILTNIPDLSTLLKSEIKSISHGVLGAYKPSFYAISLIKDSTNDTEMKRHRDLFKMLRCSSLLMLPTVLANMVGFNLNILDNSLHLFVDIGAGTITFHVVKNGTLIKNKIINKGGNTITNIFKLGIRREAQISLSHIEAEEIKLDYFNNTISDSFIPADYCHKCEDRKVAVPTTKINAEIERFNAEVGNSLLTFIQSLNDEVKEVLLQQPIYVSGNARFIPNLLKSLNNIHKVSEQSFLPNDITAMGIKKIQDHIELYRPYLIC